MKTLRVLRNGPAIRLKEALAQGAVVWVDAQDEAEVSVQEAQPAASPPPSPVARTGELTPRELEMLEFLADGWANEEIADRLGITGHTVKFHLDGLYRKLGVGRRTEAVREGYRLGLLRL